MNNESEQQFAVGFMGLAALVMAVVSIVMGNIIAAVAGVAGAGLMAFVYWKYMR